MSVDSANASCADAFLAHAHAPPRCARAPRARRALFSGRGACSRTQVGGSARSTRHFWQPPGVHLMAKRPHTQRCCICTTPRSKRLACCTRVRTPSHADTHDLAATHATRTGAPTTRQRHASHVIAAEGGAVVHKKNARELSAPTRAVAFARARTRPHAPRAGPARAPPPPRGVRTSAKRLNWPNCVTTPSALCSTHAKQKQLLNEAEAIATAAGRTAGLLAPPWTRAGGRRVRGVARAAASGVRARTYLSHRAFDIKRRHILTPTRKFGRLEVFCGFIWNAF